MTSWTYDLRGRVTKEAKTITGGGTFVTRWEYDAMDRVAWIKYPAGNASQEGETVYYDYTAQGLLDLLWRRLSDVHVGLPFQMLR